MKKRSVIFSGICIVALLFSGCKSPAPAVELAPPLTLPTEVVLPTAGLVALGTATHGNGQPFDAALQLLQRLYEQNGDVAFLLEDTVGTGIRLQDTHSFYDEEQKKPFGFPIYSNQEMQAILDWSKEKGVRLYGIDIQSIHGIDQTLYGEMKRLAFPRANEIPWKLGFSAEKGSKNDGLKTECLAEMQSYLAQMAAEGRITEQEFEWDAYLIHNVAKNRDYRQGGEQFTTRDQMMAENAAWLVAYEAKYYGNTCSLLLASNGHVLKTDFGLAGTQTSQMTPMGAFLAEKLGTAYYAIVTEAQQNTFYAQSGQRANTRKVFQIQRELPCGLPVHNEKLAFLTAEDLGGIQQWDLTVVGWYFTKARTQKPAYYTIPTTPARSYDAMLLYESLTPYHEN